MTRWLAFALLLVAGAAVPGALGLDHHPVTPRLMRQPATISAASLAQGHRCHRPACTPGFCYCPSSRVYRVRSAAPSALVQTIGRRVRAALPPRPTAPPGTPGDRLLVASETSATYLLGGSYSYLHGDDRSGTLIAAGPPEFYEALDAILEDAP